MADAETLAVYAKRAQDYADRFTDDGPNTHLNAFMDALPKGARVLDLGCGPGRATRAMLDSGLRVDAWDASPEFARVAQEMNGVTVTLASFDDLAAETAYDGIYANFSLLHAPKAEMPGHLARIARALTPGGLFHIGTKTGSGEKRDKLGRFYAYYTEEELTGLLEGAGLAITYRRTGEEPGLDGTVAPWIILHARKT
ncbi:MAG: class I SAM-dependent methyltransferase [Silicimonas sp.]|jgi:SAM-dependent methyltransferase|nr:class I SAM-dependent methyltransferase [Silicimonas sp.]